MKLTIQGNILFLPIEVMNREYKAKLLLANYFLQAGYSVVIGSIWHMDNLLADAEQCVYITKDFYKYRGDFLKTLHKKNHYVVGWDEEGLIYDTDEYYIGTQLNDETLKSLDLIITWGERQKKTITKFLPSCEGKVFSLGNPRLDLLQKHIAEKIFGIEIDYIDKHFGNDYILANSNFNVATREDYDAVGMTMEINGATQKTVELVNRMDVLSKSVASLFFQAVKHISEHFPNKKIILRPHPAENIETLKIMFQNYKNIFVMKNFAVNPWLVNASIIIHSGCTTGMEAVIMGKKVLSYQPKISLDYPDTIPDKVSQVVHTEDELFSVIDSLRDLNKGNALSDNKELMLKDYVEIDFNKTSCEKILEKIQNQNKKQHGIARFNVPLFASKKFKNAKDFNNEFGSLHYDDLQNDLLYIKENMHFDYKQKIFAVNEHVFLIANETESDLDCKLDFSKPFRLARRLLKKILK